MIFLMLLMLFQPLSTEAQEQVKTDDALLCLNATIAAEEKYQIQPNLLTTISSVETGRWNERLEQRLPWPWTVNIKGKGHYYKSKAEAVAAVKKWRKRGVTSVDVGCMQINMRFHGKEFASIEDAFDPQKNTEFAAKFLKKRYELRKNWMQAATDYHSRKAKKARAYKRKLLSEKTITEKARTRFAAQYVTYASNFMVTKDNRGWFAKLFTKERVMPSLKISLKD